MDAIAKLLVPAGQSAEAARAFERRFWVLLAGAIAVRLIVLFTLPIDLSGDETYYWEWGRRLDWGYFSKPPGIGWLMAGIRAIGLDSTVGIRSAGVALGTASTLWFFLLGRSMYGAQAGFLAALSFVFTPAAAALHNVLTTDALLMCCWGLALVSFWRYLSDPLGKSGDVAVLGLALAAGALSKQMMLVFPALAIFHVATTPEHRSRVRRVGFWAAMFAPFASLAPPLWWNYRHDWVTFGRTVQNLTQREHGFVRAAKQLLTFLASEAGLITPVGYVLLMTVVAGAGLRWKKLGVRERFLVMFSAPGLAGTLAMTTRETVNANWSAVFYVAAAVLLAAWAVRGSSAGYFYERMRVAAMPGLWLAVLMTVAAYAAAYAIAYRAAELGSFNPLAQVMGWRPLAARVQIVRSAVPRPAETFVVAVGHRYLASELAFYLPDRPRVFLYRDSERIESQYDLWPGPSERRGEDAFIVVEDGREFPIKLRGSFESIQDIGAIETPRANAGFAKLHAYLGKRLLEWPAPETRTPKAVER